jgi:hypothetical protein
LRGDTYGRKFGDIDRFLSWGVEVLRVLINEREYDDAERVATALFRATADIHQFKPARAILDWLNGLNQRAQQAMEAALHSSSSWDFFKEQAEDMYRPKNENNLVMRLRSK